VKNADMPAMPVRGGDGEPIGMGLDDAILWCREATGMSKREMMAMHFTSALMANHARKGMTAKAVAALAIRQADATLYALECTPFYEEMEK